MDDDRRDEASPVLTPERWRQVERVLDAALNEPAEQRLAWVAEASGRMQACAARSSRCWHATNR